MKKIEKVLLATYAFEDYHIELIEFDGEYEAWLQHKEYGVKDLVYREKKEQQELDEFLAAVKEKLPQYIEKYEESYY